MGQGYPPHHRIDHPTNSPMPWTVGPFLQSYVNSSVPCGKIRIALETNSPHATRIGVHFSPLGIPSETINTGTWFMERISFPLQTTTTIPTLSYIVLTHRGGS
ncbi:hypothetical protein AXF42_Ash011812 [Apostasia shenzhenica]|uniref:Uncharacterized protein n=1 Tax=Apostasia shenzhenica TaxID=1088818 RepID=A0A2I0AVW9_9ASPA|nr:hypothetical protein AXF42_Ash011812 [Apostasia shenzhenica]